MTDTDLQAAPARRRIPRRTLWLLVPIVLVLAVGTWFVQRNPTSDEPLAPDNPQPGGARAIAQVLGQQGVEVQRVTSRQELTDRPGSGGTLVVTEGAVVSAEQWRELRPTLQRFDRVVLVRAGAAAPLGLDLPVEVRPSAFPQEVPAQCTVPVASGLTLDGRGERYARTDLTRRATVCFRPGADFDVGGDDAGQLAWVPATGDDPEIVLLGSPDPLRNSTVETAGNAALGLRALGAHNRLVWWTVRETDADPALAEPARFPDWVGPVWLMLGVTAAVLMLARGRRLGRLVTEPLPVVVRADETTRARGQLYRKAADVPRAAAVLRAGTRRRLSSYLQTGSRDDALVAAVTDATGRPGPEVQHLLLGPPPTSEADLTSLAQQLHTLEKEVRPR